MTAGEDYIGEQGYYVEFLGGRGITFQLSRRVTVVLKDCQHMEWCVNLEIRVVVSVPQSNAVRNSSMAKF